VPTVGTGSRSRSTLGRGPLRRYWTDANPRRGSPT